MMEEICYLIIRLLNRLPDNTAHTIGMAEDETWYWCWKELSDEAQAEVKAVRKAANDLLAVIKKELE